jgi:hypothetical protein
MSIDVDAALERAREVPSRSKDQELLREAIAAVRQQRAKVLRQLAEYDSQALMLNTVAQRKEVEKREAKQRKMLADLLAFEELDVKSAGSPEFAAAHSLSAAIDHATGLLHVSKTRMVAQALDSQQREAHSVAGRPVDSGQCSGSDLEDLIRRIVDADGLYPNLGPWNLAPTFESIRQWFAAQEKTASEQAKYGKVSYKLVWEHGEIVVQGRYNVQSGVTVEPRKYVESFAPSGGPIPPGARVTEVVKR